MKKLPPTGVKGFEQTADLGQAQQTGSRPKVDPKHVAKTQKVRSTRPVHDVHEAAETGSLGSLQEHVFSGRDRLGASFYGTLTMVGQGPGAGDIAELNTSRFARDLGLPHAKAKQLVSDLVAVMGG